MYGSNHARQTTTQRCAAADSKACVPTANLAENALLVETTVIDISARAHDLVL